MSDWPTQSDVYRSGRDFRTRKRQDVRAVLNCMDDLRLGCAFTPAYQHILAATKHLEHAKELMSVKKWKR